MQPISVFLYITTFAGFRWKNSEQRWKGQSYLKLNHYNNSEVFIKHSNDMNERNPNKEGKTLILFNNSIAGKITNKKLPHIITELFHVWHNLILLYQKILD